MKCQKNADGEGRTNTGRTDCSIWEGDSQLEESPVSTAA